MPTFTMSTQIKVAFESCARCGTVFGMTEELQNQFRKNKETFYCPVGHAQSYTRSEADNLKAQLKAKDDELLRTKRRLEWEETNANRLKENLSHTERRLSATKGVLTRTKNRIANGVCPCCNRYFADLHKHMSGQHPDFQAEETISALPALLDPSGAPPLPTGEDMMHQEQPSEASTAIRRGRPKGSRNAAKGQRHAC
ncbi:MAG: hypothetical protein ACRYFS_10335 [Janthinobacterium lividum]